MVERTVIPIWEAMYPTDHRLYGILEEVQRWHAGEIDDVNLMEAARVAFRIAEEKRGATHAVSVAALSAAYVAARSGLLVHQNISNMYVVCRRHYKTARDARVNDAVWRRVEDVFVLYVSNHEEALETGVIDSIKLSPRGVDLELSSL